MKNFSWPLYPNSPPIYLHYLVNAIYAASNTVTPQIFFQQIKPASHGQKCLQTFGANIKHCCSCNNLLQETAMFLFALGERQCLQTFRQTSLSSLWQVTEGGCWCVVCSSRTHNTPTTYEHSTARVKASLSHLQISWVWHSLKTKVCEHLALVKPTLPIELPV